MKIDVPDAVANHFTPDELLLDLAMGMYAARHITLGRGAEMTGLTQLAFQRELARRRIPLHYDLEDLAIDVQAVREMSGP